MNVAKLFAVGAILGIVSGCGASSADDRPDHTDSPPQPQSWDGKGDCLWCDFIGPDPSGAPTRYPIVLAHGMGASSSHFGFYKVADTLRALDHQIVYEGDVPPFQAADERAKALAVIVDRALNETGAAKVHIIAHSMGGLDARALVATYKYGDRVASITTISTPHFGSSAADAILATIDDNGGDFSLLDAFTSTYGATFSDANTRANVRDTLWDISERGTYIWNQYHVDDPRVLYQSVAGVSGIPSERDLEACSGQYFDRRSGKPAYPGGSEVGADIMSPLVLPFASSVEAGTWLDDGSLGPSGPNDGLVTVESAKWGTFLGCIPADHADEVGAIAHNFGDARTGFDHKRFYRNLVFDLARTEVF